jgi:hypothetical protein
MTAEADVVHLVQLAAIVEDHSLFPQPVVADARTRLNALVGEVPTLAQLSERYSAETVYGIAARVIDERDRMQREIDEELGVDSPCHLCGTPRDHNDGDYLFGLARVASKQTQWAGSIAALAANALTVPFGVFVGALPGSHTRAYIKRCRLVLCGMCTVKRKGSFWNNHEMRVTHADCAKHSSWNRLSSQGYDTFLTRLQLEQFH